MKILKTDNSYYFDDNGIVAAEVTYSRAGDTMIIIDHTSVHDDYRHQGLAKKLVYEIVYYARENNLKIIPLCPFAKATFQKDDTLKDILKK